MIEGSGGLHLFTMRNEIETPKGAVIILHGYCEHSLRYDHVVSFLADAGYNTYLLDHRGHGKSEGPRAAVMRFEEYLEDMDIFIETVRKQYPEGPLFLLGHSMGGLIAGLYMLTRKPAFNGVILSSPYLGLKVDVPAWKDVMGRVMSVLIPSLSMKSELDPMLLTHDVAIAEEYVADPMVSKIANARWYVEADRAQQMVMERAGEWVWPSLIMHGGDDRIADPATTKKFAEKIGRPDVAFSMLEGMYHEIYNEVDRKQVLGMTVNWLGERLEKE
jgi:alpha-beta hydrolase superfamily lysophospholipase